MWSELWDTASGNRLARYETREAALKGVAELVNHTRGHPTATASLAILECADKRNSRLIAEGEAVLRLARPGAEEPAPAAPSRRHAA